MASLLPSAWAQFRAYWITLTLVLILVVRCRLQLINSLLQFHVADFEIVESVSQFGVAGFEVRQAGQESNMLTMELVGPEERCW